MQLLKTLSRRLRAFESHFPAQAFEPLEPRQMLSAADPVPAALLAPAIGSLVAGQPSYDKGQTATITALDVTAPDANVKSISFYLDANFNGKIDSADTLLGLDTNSADGWSINVDTTSSKLGFGFNRILAYATDDSTNPNTSPLVSTNLILLPGIDGPYRNDYATRYHDNNGKIIDVQLTGPGKMTYGFDYNIGYYSINVTGATSSTGIHFDAGYKPAVHGIMGTLTISGTGMGLLNAPDIDFYTGLVCSVPIRTTLLGGYFASNLTLNGSDSVPINAQITNLSVKTLNAYGPVKDITVNNWTATHTDARLHFYNNVNNLGFTTSFTGNLEFNGDVKQFAVRTAFTGSITSTRNIDKIMAGTFSGCISAYSIGFLSIDSVSNANIQVSENLDTFGSRYINSTKLTVGRVGKISTWDVNGLTITLPFADWGIFSAFNIMLADNVNDFHIIGHRSKTSVNRLQITNKISNSSIDITGTLSNLICETAENVNITVGKLGTLTVKKTSTNVNVTVSHGGSRSFFSLLGNVNSFTIDTAGAIQSFTALSASDLDIHAESIVSLVVRNGLSNADISVTGNINTISAKSLDDVSITAAHIGSTVVVTDMRDSDFTLTRPTSRANFIIRGNVFDSTIQTAGSLGAISGKSFTNTQIKADDVLYSLVAVRGNFSGAIQADSIGSITIVGNLMASVFSGSFLNLLNVTGALSSSRVAGSYINLIAVGQMFNSAVIAGSKLGNDSLPFASLAAALDDRTAYINSVVIRSPGSTAAPSFVNSIVAGYRLGNVLLKTVDFTNEDNTFGIAAVNRITRVSATGLPTRLNLLPGSADTDKNDFTIRILD